MLDLENAVAEIKAKKNVEYDFFEKEDSAGKYNVYALKNGVRVHVMLLKNETRIRVWKNKAAKEAVKNIELEFVEKRNYYAFDAKLETVLETLA